MMLSHTNTLNKASAGSPAQASELTSAVADMLSAAGVPLDLDTQKLLQQTLAANAQLQQVGGVCV